MVLQKAGLWNEVKDRLTENATSLSGGQQQKIMYCARYSSKAKSYING